MLQIVFRLTMEKELLLYLYITALNEIYKQTLSLPIAWDIGKTLEYNHKVPAQLENNSKSK